MTSKIIAHRAISTEPTTGNFRFFGLIGNPIEWIGDPVSASRGSDDDHKSFARAATSARGKKAPGKP
eukprot:gene21978-22993_t